MTCEGPAATPHWRTKVTEQWEWVPVTREIRGPLGKAVIPGDWGGGNVRSNSSSAV